MGVKLIELVESLEPRENCSQTIIQRINKEIKTLNFIIICVNTDVFMSYIYKV